MLQTKGFFDAQTKYVTKLKYENLKTEEEKKSVSNSIVKC